MKNKKRILLTAIFGALYLCYTADSIKWLAITRAGHAWNETSCPKNKHERQLYGLTGSQVKVCRRHNELMSAIYQAARNAKRECMIQFMDRRWNCSSINSAPKLTPDLRKGTREQAFVYALSAAAIAHSVARLCAIGSTIRLCGCGWSDRYFTGKDKHDWAHRGCSDDIDYGIEVSKVFADAPWTRQKRRRQKSIASPLLRRFDALVVKRAPEERNRFKKSTPRIYMNQHNNDVGRKVIIETYKRHCKCHGVSGTCTQKTCRMMLPKLKEVGERLKTKYRDALEVRPRTKPMGFFEAVYHKTGTITNDDLIFVKKSPDFCTKDDRLGSVGTYGRRCNTTKEMGHGDCASMCCGRGFTETKMNLSTKCHCKFVYCCQVYCKQCTEEIILQICK